MIKKKIKIQKVKCVTISGSLVLLLLSVFALRAVPACAQGSQELLTAITQKMGQSMQALTGYSYKQRTEVQIKGETKSVALVQVAFGPDKKPIVTTLSSQPSEDTGRGLRGRIRKEKADEMKEAVQELIQLSNSYLTLSQEKLQQLVRQGKVLVSPDSGNVTVEVSGLLQMGDQMAMNCEGKTMNRTQTQVQTTADGSPVTITAQYQTLPTGLNYNAQTVVNVPAKGLQITLNTMNYQQVTATATASVPQGPQDPGWPRQRIENGNKLVIYQPQVDDWKDFMELDWRMAIELTPKGGKPVVGVVVLKGHTQVDNDKKMVLISNLEVVKTHFPSLDPVRAEQMDQLARTFLPPAVSISLHRLVACVPKKESVPDVQLKNDPPDIYVSYKPAILMDVDGKPIRASIQNAKLEYVVNTHWPLFFDPQSSMFYLLVGEQWLVAPALEGPWAATGKLPKDMNMLVNEPQWADLKKFIPPPPAKPNTVAPAIFYSTSPAEVILFNGKPGYAQIPGTRLQYANNTTSYVFLYTPTNQYYYLTAGRWFSANSLDGPWMFATPSLPADFAQIPGNSPAAQVLASVPGTEEAKDAVLMAQIPTTVIVDPAAATAAVKVTYAGTPQFILIEGTSLYYATNTSQKVIKVGDLYYVCFQGIWFVSSIPQGPWQTAQSVPQVIYTIPPSSPVYNVTYVTQVTTSDGNVQASHTAGYMGAFVMGVATGTVIAGGTGYYYPPYVAAYPGYTYPVYYPTPCTYGAASYYHSATGAYGVSQTAYGPYGSATKTASYNPYTGTYAKTGSVSTAYGSAAAGRAYNPYTGASAATMQGSNAYASWGSSVVSKGGQTAYTQHYSTAQGTAGSVQTSSGGKAGAATTSYGTTAAAKTASGNMYAGHDGNVYKNTGSGWEKYDSGGWNSVQKPTTPTSTTQQKPTMSQGASTQQQAQATQQQRSASGQPTASSAQQRGSSSGQSGGSEQMQQMQKEAQNRQRGEQSNQRSQQYQQSRGGGGRSWGGSGGGSRGGGGFGGGGGRGRR
jgi:hypothetical protein